MNKRSQIWFVVALLGSAIYGIFAILIGFDSQLVNLLRLLSLVFWWLFIYSRWKSKKSENEFWDGPESS